MDIPAILTDKYTGTQWTLNGDDYEGLEWLDSSPKPSKEELEALWPEVQHIRAIKQIELQRAQAYREISDPLFFQFQRGEIEESVWLNAVQEIKNQYPYPEELNG